MRMDRVMARGSRRFGGQKIDIPDWDVSVREGARALGVAAIRNGVERGPSNEADGRRGDDSPNSLGGRGLVRERGRWVAG